MSRPERTLEGLVILVTGGASGIGKACGAEITARGGIAVVADVDEVTGNRTVAELGDAAAFERLDVRSETDWAAVCDRVVDRHGRLDGLVNCAGVDAPNDNIDQLDTAGWRRIMDINLDGVFLGCQAAIRSMRKQNRGGAIVNIASILGIVADGNTLAYSTSKGAVRHLTKSAALHTARERLGIRLNSVHPGYVNTAMTERWVGAVADESGEAADKAARSLGQSHPLGRIAEPGEIASMVAFLLSSEAAFITAAEYVVDGGYTAS